jgi:hypothetical protein
LNDLKGPLGGYQKSLGKKCVIPNTAVFPSNGSRALLEYVTYLKTQLKNMYDEVLTVFEKLYPIPLQKLVLDAAKAILKKEFL